MKYVNDASKLRQGYLFTEDNSNEVYIVDDVYDEYGTMYVHASVIAAKDNDAEHLPIGHNMTLIGNECSVFVLDEMDILSLL